MTKITLLTFTVFLTITLYFNSALSANNDDYTVDAKRKDGDKKYSPLWFGPRIGRRKRNPSEDVFKNLDRDDMEALLETFRNNPWVLPFSNGKRHSMGFTPRLGRESGEEAEDVDFGDYISHRSPPFAPRLGRRLTPYSPRLGRENDILLQQ